MHDKSSLIPLLQEILAENPSFFFPNQLSILTWKSKTTPNALVTKINGQRYLGLAQKDIKGQDYWKYKPLKASDLENSEALDLNQPNDSIAKFQHRQEQVKNYANHANASKE